MIDVNDLIVRPFKKGVCIESTTFANDAKVYFLTDDKYTSGYKYRAIGSNRTPDHPDMDVVYSRLFRFARGENK
jgi:hypothetical protein